MFLLHIISFILYLFFAMPLFWFDITKLILPDKLVLGLLLSGLLINLINIANLYNAIYGMILGFFLLYVLYWGYYLIKKKEGLGQGDIKLLAALGAWFGVYYLPYLLLFSSIFGLILFLFFNNILKVNKKLEYMPFGSCLLFVGFLFIFYFLIFE